MPNYRLRKVPKKDLYYVVGPDGKHHSKEGMPKDKAEAQKRILEAAAEKEIKGGDARPDTAPSHHNICGFPLKTYWTAAKASYKLVNGNQPEQRIGEGWKIFNLIDSTPTLLFYVCEGEDDDGVLHPTCLVAVRGSVTAEDWKANTQIPLNNLRNTDRIQKDLDKIRDVRIRLIGQYGAYPVRWIGVGHSLGGAIIDILLADKLVDCAVTYNAAVESQYRHHSHNHRIYNEYDPLYYFMGRFAKIYQVRKSDKPKGWTDWALWVAPWAKLLVSGYQSLYAHNLDRFIGGAKKYKNLLYGGVMPAECGSKGHMSPDGKSRLYTEAECDSLGGVYSEDTNHCFVNGEDYSKKCVDSTPSPPPPEPFKPVPYEPGKPDKPGPEPFKPVPYEPGKPDKPGPEPFKPVPYEPGKPDKPIEPIPINPPYVPPVEPFKPVPINPIVPPVNPPVGPDPNTLPIWERGKKYELGDKVKWPESSGSGRKRGGASKKYKGYEALEVNTDQIPSETSAVWRDMSKPPPVDPDRPEKPLGPGDVLPGVRRPCELPGGRHVEAECIDSEIRRLGTPEWDHRMTVVHAALLNAHAEADTKNSPIFGACCGNRVKVNEGGQMVYDTKKFKNTSESPCGIPFYGDPPAPRCSDYSVNDGEPVQNPDRMWDNLSKLPGDYVTQKKQIDALANASWMDAMFDQKIYSKAVYRSRIGDWCKQNPTGPCAKPSGIPFTPDQKYNNCMGGFPYNGEVSWKAARDALYWRRGEGPFQPPLAKNKGGVGAVLPAQFPQYNSQTTYPVGQVVFYGRDSNDSTLAYWKSLRETKGNEPGVKDSVFWERDYPGRPPPPPKPSIPASFSPIDYTRPKEPQKAKEFDEKYGTTYAEYQEIRDKTCKAAKEEGNIDNFYQWWNQIGSKLNSPCPNPKAQSDPYIYAPYTNVKQPICRQWRVDGTNLTASTMNDPKLLSYENRIRPTGWTRDPEGNPIDNLGSNEKWIWQHDTTYPRDVLGLHVAQPGGCDFPPVSGTDPMNYQASPEECFERQVAWRAFAEAEVENAKCKGDALDCFDWRKVAKDLTNLGINELVKFLSGDSSGKFLPKIIADILIPRCDLKTKCDFKSLDEKIQNASQEVINLLLDQFNKSQAQLPPPTEAEAYLARFGEDKRYPGFTDPVLRDPNNKTKFKVWMDETPPERRSTLLERRKMLDEQFNENLGDVDALGYHGEFRHQPGLDQSENARWRVRGGTKMAEAKVVELANRLGKFIHKHAKALYEAKKKNSLKGAGHGPHRKLAAHLRKLGVSADKYLEKVRQNANKHGLHGSLIGWSDDERHKFQIPNEEGRLVRFGSPGMGDYILYTILGDAKAAQHRRSYHARAESIRGDWKKSKYSPNSLALAVLW